MEHVNGWPFSVSFVTRGSKVSRRIDMGSHHRKQAFMSLFHTDHKFHESSRIDKYSDSWRIVSFCNPLVMFYDSVMERVRNSYEYLWDMTGFDLNRHDTVTNSLRCAKIYFEMTARKLRISHKLVKEYAQCMHKLGMNKQYKKMHHPCFQGISSKMNVPHKSAVVLTLQLNYQKQLVI